MTIADKIVELRKRAGYTQADLAKLLNVDQSAVSQWERGKVKPLKKILPAMAQALNCTVDDLQADR